MNISSNFSPSFGSLQVRTSQMSSTQRAISEKFSDAIKYDDKYLQLADEDVDVYVLPGKSDSQVEVRLMDPYSGNYIRNDKGRIIKQTLSFKDSMDKLFSASDKIVESIGKVVSGVFSRPKPDLQKIFEGDTAMAKINPDKYKVFDEDLELWLKEGCSLSDAIEMAYDNFVNLYSIGNKDADF